MKQDIVIGSASGYTFDQIRFWVNSLDRSGFAGERVVLVGNGDVNLVAQLRARDCKVITEWAADSDGRALGEHGVQQRTFRDKDMSVWRYFLIWKYLSGLPIEDTRFVISVDMRDAVFQLDPAEWLANNIGDKQLVVASEGLMCGDVAWNRETMIETFGDSVYQYLHDRLVWNGGTIAGDLATMRDLSLNLFLCCSARNVPYADQATLNVLLSLEPYRRLTMFDDGHAGWACEAATMVAAARGDAASFRFRGEEPLFDGDVVHTPAGRPYCIVHQYDRIPWWKAQLENKFG